MEPRTAGEAADYACARDSNTDAGAGAAADGDGNQVLGDEPPVEAFETGVERNVVVVQV